MKRKTDTYFYKTFFSLFAVVALQNLIVFSVNLADSMMLGSYNESAMSGVALANQIQFLLQCVINGAANGLVVIASQYWGEKKTEPIKKVFTACFWSAVCIGAVLSVLVISTPTGILGLLSDEKEIINTVQDYTRIMGFSYVIFSISFVLTALMRSVESVKIGFYTSIMTLVVNISLNYLLIFGKLGLPELGAVGAAYATLASRIVELIAVTVYVLVIDKKIRFRLSDIFHIEKLYFKDFLKAGSPLMGSGFSWGIAMALQTAIIGRLGSAAIGANAVASPLFQVVSVLYTSAGNASGVLIGKTVGENDIDRVKIYTKRLQIMYLIIGLISCVTLLAIKNPILSFYNISDDTRKLSITFIYILAVTVIGSAYEMPCLCGIVSGGGDTSFVLFNDIVFMWFMVLPLSALSAFYFKWPIAVTFFILKSDQITKCFVAAVKVNRYKWIKKLTR